MACFFIKIEMDMYRRVVLSLLSCCCLSLSAQTIDWSKSAVKPKADSIEKKILEPAKYVVTYTYRYAKDAKYPDEKREGLTVLEIGDRYNRFCDYYTLKFDSLTDEISRGKISLNEYTSMALSSLKRASLKRISSSTCIRMRQPCSARPAALPSISMRRPVRS